MYWRQYRLVTIYRAQFGGDARLSIAHTAPLSTEIAPIPDLSRSFLVRIIGPTLALRLSLLLHIETERKARLRYFFAWAFWRFREMVRDVSLYGGPEFPVSYSSALRPGYLSRNNKNEK